MAGSEEPLNGGSAGPVREDVEWREADGEITLRDMRTSEQVALNRTGSLVWESLVQGAPRDHLVGLLVGRFGITSERASADVDDFLQDLTRRGFLRS